MDHSEEREAPADHDVADDIAIPKMDHDGETSSIESTPDRELQDHGPSHDAPPQKRKGGRKPIYATSEERKQRNRQAQAAFRERRTEYIKQLEATIKQNEDSLATLQQSHRSAADECLMLRYKNSLLERILLEKGIDVQAELQVKAGSPTFTSSMLPGMTGQPQHARAQLQRAAVQRHHARRSANAMVASFATHQQSAPAGVQNAMISPQTAPTPSSHISSPSDLTGSPSMVQASSGMTSPASNPPRPMSQQHDMHNRNMQVLAEQQPLTARQLGIVAPPFSTQGLQRKVSNQFTDQTQQVRKQAPVRSIPRQDGDHDKLRLYTPPGSQNAHNLSTAANVQAASSYYPSPFQKHIDQLEHEYDIETMSQSMLDQLDHEPTTAELGRAAKHPFPPSFESNSRQTFQYQYPNNNNNNSNPIDPANHQNSQQLTPHSQDEPTPFATTSTQSPLPTELLDATYGNLAHMIDPDDPMLNADPFGLTASMHYSTAYSYEQQPRR